MLTPKFFYSGPPVIESLEYGINDCGVYVVKCSTTSSYRSPPTFDQETYTGCIKLEGYDINFITTLYHNILEYTLAISQIPTNGLCK